MVAEGFKALFQIQVGAHLKTQVRITLGDVCMEKRLYGSSN